MHTSVVLSGADGSRSEPSAKSKDPSPARITTNSSRSFYYALSLETGNWQLGTGN